MLFGLFYSREAPLNYEFNLIWFQEYYWFFMIDFCDRFYRINYEQHLECFKKINLIFHCCRFSILILNKEDDSTEKEKYDGAESKDQIYCMDQSNPNWSHMIAHTFLNCVNTKLIRIASNSPLVLEPLIKWKMYGSCVQLPCCGLNCEWMEDRTIKDIPLVGNDQSTQLEDDAKAARLMNSTYPIGHQTSQAYDLNRHCSQKTLCENEQKNQRLHHGASPKGSQEIQRHSTIQIVEVEILLARQIPMLPKYQRGNNDNQCTIILPAAVWSGICIFDCFCSHSRQVPTFSLRPPLSKYTAQIFCRSCKQPSFFLI